MKRPSNELHRGAVDERRLVASPFDAAAQSQLLEDHGANRLATIAAGASPDYYVAFNASDRAEVERQQASYRYVLVVIDGRLRATDGTSALEMRGPP